MTARWVFPRTRAEKSQRAVRSERPRRHWERAAWTEERVAAARRRRSAVSRRVAGEKVRRRAVARRGRSHARARVRTGALLQGPDRETGVDRRVLVRLGLSLPGGLAAAARVCGFHTNPPWCTWGQSSSWNGNAGRGRVGRGQGVRGKPREIMRTVPSADCQVLDSGLQE